MPIEPVEDLLPRKMDSPEVEAMLGKFSSLIDESVNFGTHVFKWCCDAVDGSDENVPLLFSLRHILDLLDSVSTLVRQGSADPCKVLLRAVLESFLGLRYIVEAKSTDRALAFMYWHYIDTKKLYNKIDPETAEGKEFRTLLAADNVVGDSLTIAVPDELQKTIGKIDDLLKQPRYANAEAEYRRLRPRGHGHPRWYSAYEGPRNLKDLAIHLGLAGLYEILYRPWSGSTHGTDIMHGKVTRVAKGEIGIMQIRFPKGLQELVSLSLYLSFETYKALIEFFVPQRRADFSSWYSKDIRRWYLRLSSQELFIVKDAP